MRCSLRLAILLGTGWLVPALTLRAQEPATPPAPTTPSSLKAEAAKPATDPIDRIKEEGLKKSRVMTTLSYLTDVIGPRLTGSPNMKRANEWTRDRMASWGMKNAHLEAWGPFGRGWTLKRFSAQVVEPQCIPLIAFPKAWSPGTEGTIVAPVVYFNARTEADFATYKGKLKGAIVLRSSPSEVKAHFEPLGTRKTDAQLLELADAGEPAQRGRGRFGGDPKRRARMIMAAKTLNFLADEGVAMIVDPSPRGDGGTLFVQSASVPGPVRIPGGPGEGRRPPRRVSPWQKDAPKIPPQMVMAQEHYNRLVRMIEAGDEVKIALDVDVQFHNDDLMAYNTIAEIPGTDPKLKDEVVMLGGHMDSWHSGTGATDNGAGVAVAMEAARIIKALDLKPKRTIRVALWSGEEQGLLGSRAYVTRHFGISPPNRFGPSRGETPPNKPTPEFDQFQAYFNLDNGTGKIRGVYLQGNEALRPIFRKWLQPFRELGATTLSLRNTGSTDHVSFDAIGLPGFQFIQDEIEYGTRTHHSNQDVFDRVQADDMKQASTIMAAFVYNAATMDEKLPRKPATTRGSGRRGLARN